MISVTQLNLHKATLATSLVGRSLEGQRKRVLLLTEPYTVNSRVVGMPRKAQVIFDRTTRANNLAVRAAIVATPDLNITPLDAWCTRDCAAALTRVHNRQTLLVSLYCDILLPLAGEHLLSLLNMATSKGLPVILAMDSNAHSVLFGPTSNKRGDDFEDLVMSHGLTVENVGEDPTFETQRNNKVIRTCIDVTLSRDLHIPVSNWRVDRSYNASDHNSIYFELQSPTDTQKEVRPWSKADWTIFRKVLSEYNYFMPSTISMKKLDKMLHVLYKALELALDSSCPKITVTEGVRPDQWFSDKHKAGKDKVSRLYSLAKRSGTPADWANYKAADKQFKKTCKLDKNKAWRRYKESIQNSRDVATLVKIAQRQESRNIGVLRKEDDSFSDPGSDTIALLSRAHFPAATPLRRVVYNNHNNLDAEAILSKYTDWITVPLIREALSGFEKKKSPGPDEIKPLIFDHVPVEFLNVLQFIYRSCIHLGYTPKEWKRTKVIFISKPGKSSYINPKSFRPISLSNYMLKGLERLVGWRMDSALVNHPLHPKQHGFLVGRSTESALSQSTNYIERFVMRNQHCVGVFLDISSAFDSIQPDHVKRSLLEHGGDPDLVQWYYNYITHRDIEIDLHGDRSVFSTGVGFPQGGVCSAKFWLIAFDRAIRIINSLQIEGNGYADDCSALYGGIRIDHSIDRLQTMLDRLVQWGSGCGLKFNADKSVAVLFSRSRKTPQSSLYIDGKAVPFADEVRYLGVTLDRKLHWTPHITDKLSKAKKFLSNVAAITRRNWGPKPKLMRWAFQGIVRPMICYASMIWGHRAAFVSDKLRRVNRMAINTFACFPRSTPTAALEIILDVVPLHLFCLQQGLAARIRLDPVLRLGWEGTNSKKTHAVSHIKFWNDHLTRANINIENVDTCYRQARDCEFCVNLDSFDGRAKHRVATQFNVYTDGSRINNQTGAGFVLYRGQRLVEEHLYRLPDFCTVFQAEITAITMAARALLSLQTRPTYVKILVDSQAALRALLRSPIRSRTVSDAIEALNKLASVVRRVTLLWIPAHRGLFGNSRADDLAKLGAESSLPNNFIKTPRPAASIASELWTYIYKNWTTEWQGSTAARHTKHFYFSPSRHKASYIHKLARLDLGRFVRIVTGHNNLNYFQSRIGLWGDQTCRFCRGGPETFIHFLSDCPCFLQSRRDVFLDNIPSNDMKWSARKLIAFSQIPGLDNALVGTWAHGDPAGIDDLQTEDEHCSDASSTVTNSVDRP